MSELDFAFVHGATDRRGRGRFRRGRQRDMALRREQARGRVHADPAGTGEIDLGPGVQVGEVELGAAGAVQRLHVRLELDQVAGYEPRRQAEIAQNLHQQPGRVAARAGTGGQGFFRRLHARFHANQVFDVLLQGLIDFDQKIDRLVGLARYRFQVFLKAAADTRGSQERFEILHQGFVVAERERVSARFHEEVEGVVRRHFGNEVHGDLEFRDLFRKHDARLPVAVRVLLPVEEVRIGFDLERVRQHACFGVRRRAQADDLRRQRDRAVIAVFGTMRQRDVDAHGERGFPLLCVFARLASQAGSACASADDA